MSLNLRMRSLFHERLGLWRRPKTVARQGERSMIYSAEDDVGPNDRLLDLALETVQAARGISLQSLSRRLASPPYYPDVWPGEHYRLLAALVRVLQPSVCIEIGTATGLSALAMCETLPDGGQVATFDIVSWRDYPGGVLTDEDFVGGRLVQYVEDLTHAEVEDRHRGLLQRAGLIFVDAAKDGEQELDFLHLFERVDFEGEPILVFDDIRQWKMLHIWRAVKRPKLDLTSFGHWSGTGLIDLGHM